MTISENFRWSECRSQNQGASHFWLKTNLNSWMRAGGSLWPCMSVIQERLHCTCVLHYKSVLTPWRRPCWHGHSSSSIRLSEQRSEEKQGSTCMPATLFTLQVLLRSCNKEPFEDFQRCLTPLELMHKPLANRAGYKICNRFCLAAFQLAAHQGTFFHCVPVCVFTETSTTYCCWFSVRAALLFKQFVLILVQRNLNFSQILNSMSGGKKKPLETKTCFFFFFFFIESEVKKYWNYQTHQSR